MELDSSLSWLALGLPPGLGALLTARLLRECGSPEKVFAAPLTALERCNLPAVTAQAIASQGAFSAAQKELAQIRTLGVQLLHWEETAYPSRLLEIYDPPSPAVCARKH